MVYLDLLSIIPTTMALSDLGRYIGPLSDTNEIIPPVGVMSTGSKVTERSGVSFVGWRYSPSKGAPLSQPVRKV